MTRTRVVALAGLTVALAAGMTVATWAASGSSGGVGPGGRRPGAGVMMGGPALAGRAGMMGGAFAGGLAGDGHRVGSLDTARVRAQAFADRLGLRVGEVIHFSNGFYAELTTVDGQGATEVLIDPDTGGVSLEYGPAMMWNTRYGMHGPAGATAGTVSPEQARAIAQRWLDEHQPGLAAGEPDVFPGYVTVDTSRGATMVSMMSVNTSTGAVWYHTWHGRYLESSDR
jgi:hypothetical protein